MTQQPGKLETLLQLPFEQYMAGCWEHTRELALNDPIANIVYQELLAAPAAMEALWARRYWFSKVGAAA